MSGRAVIEAQSEGPGPGGALDFPRWWSGTYNGSVPSRLDITEIAGARFRGEVGYRHETRPVEGELSASPDDIEGTKGQIRSRHLAALLSVVFRTPIASAGSGDEWIYRAMASRQKMVGRCYRSGGELAAFELESAM